MESDVIFVYGLVVLLGIAAGASFGFSSIYLSKFATYMSKQAAEPHRPFMKILDLLWRVMTPLVFGACLIYLPVELISRFIPDLSVRKASFTIYLFTLLISGFIGLLWLRKKKHL